jgi:hypothetical protein
MYCGLADGVPKDDGGSVHRCYLVTLHTPTGTCPREEDLSWAAEPILSTPGGFATP